MHLDCGNALWEVSMCVYLGVAGGQKLMPAIYFLLSNSHIVSTHNIYNVEYREISIFIVLLRPGKLAYLSLQIFIISLC